MRTPLSPSDIEVMLHCYTTPCPHPRLNAPAVKEALDMFLDAGMIEPEFTSPTTSSIAYYKATDKGAAFVKAICNTPEPVCVWIIPEAGAPRTV